MAEKIPRSRGRPSATSRETLEKIIAEVALGGTLRSICARPGYPSSSAFRVAIMQDPELREAWEVAKAERPHNLFEEAIDLARALKEGTWAKDQTNQVSAMRIAIEGLREAAARMAPREYGVRPASSVVVPVQINTTLDLSPGLPRGIAASDTYSVEIPLPAPDPARDQLAPPEEP